jgi:ABC-2 type transport system ATP-binding protein
MINLKNLQKTVNQVTAIDIEDLSIQSGEIAAIVGPVDSGKDLLLDLLTGKSRPSMGTVRVAQIDPFSDKDAFSRQVGVQFSEENLYKRQSALGNLKFYCRLRRLPKVRAEVVLAEVGLADDAGTQVEKLSSSLVRRLLLARAILHDPAVLLLVEPFDKCDDASVAIMSKVIHQKAEAGAAVLFITEGSTHLQDLCSVIYRLEKGRVVDVVHPAEEQAPALPFMIPAKLEDKVALVNPADILYIVAQDERAYLQTAEELFPTQFTLAELEKRLSRSGFFRAHRGYLVNLQHVKEVIPYTRDSYTLRLKDAKGTEIPLSKSAARELRELLGY